MNNSIEIQSRGIFKITAEDAIKIISQGVQSYTIEPTLDGFIKCWIPKRDEYEKTERMNDRTNLL